MSLWHHPCSRSVYTRIAARVLNNKPQSTISTNCWGSLACWGPKVPQKLVGAPRSRENSGSHIDASHSRQPLVKGERLLHYEVNAVMHGTSSCNPRALGKKHSRPPFLLSFLEKQDEISFRRHYSGIPGVEKLFRHHSINEFAVPASICYPKRCAAPDMVPCQCNT